MVSPLPRQTKLYKSNGDYFLIESCIGKGSSSMLYHAVLMHKSGEKASETGFCLKECVPSNDSYRRSAYGAICADKEDAQAEAYLWERRSRFINEEMRIGQEIANKVLAEAPQQSVDITAIEVPGQIRQNGSVRHFSSGPVPELCFLCMRDLSERGDSLINLIEELEKKDNDHDSGQMTVAHAVILMEKVIELMRQFHAAGYVMGDLTPYNIWVFRKKGTPLNDIVLCPLDFGCAHRLLPDQNKTKAIRIFDIGSTAGFSFAPELIVGENGMIRLTAQFDQYAAGQLFYRFLKGRKYFQEYVINREKLIQSGKSLQFPKFTLSDKELKERGVNSGARKKIRTILQTCLQPRPGNRYVDSNGKSGDDHLLKDIKEFQQRQKKIFLQIIVRESDGYMIKSSTIWNIVSFAALFAWFIGYIIYYKLGYYETDSPLFSDSAGFENIVNITGDRFDLSMISFLVFALAAGVCLAFFIKTDFDWQIAEHWKIYGGVAALVMLTAFLYQEDLFSINLYLPSGVESFLNTLFSSKGLFMLALIIPAIGIAIIRHQVQQWRMGILAMVLFVLCCLYLDFFGYGYIHADAFPLVLIVPAACMSEKSHKVSLKESAFILLLLLLSGISSIKLNHDYAMTAVILFTGWMMLMHEKVQNRQLSGLVFLLLTAFFALAFVMIMPYQFSVRHLLGRNLTQAGINFIGRGSQYPYRYQEGAGFAAFLFHEPFLTAVTLGILAFVCISMFWPRSGTDHFQNLLRLTAGTYFLTKTILWIISGMFLLLPRAECPFFCITDYFIYAAAAFERDEEDLSKELTF